MNTSGGKTLRFGILCDHVELEAWQIKCLEALVRVPGCVPVLVVLNVTPQPKKAIHRRLLDALLTGGFGWSLFSWLVAARPSPATDPLPLPDWLHDVQRMECAVSKKGRYSEYFSDQDISRLRAAGLDFLMKFGFGITRGAILDCARYGVWSFHHDDETRYRGAPPSFWEIYCGDPVTGSILQRLTEKLDAGVVLRRGYFQTILDSYVKNRDQAYWGSTEWPAQVCRDILNNAGAYVDHPPSATKAPIFRYPGNLRTAVFAVRMARNWLKSKIENLFLCDVWNIGIVSEPVESIARRGSIGNVRWLAEPGSDSYFADPSGVLCAPDDLWILAEDYNYLKGRGAIAACRFSRSTGAGPWKTAIESSFHLSFPHVFEHDGRIYCVPECAESNEIALYAAESFPFAWKRIATLVPHFPGVDATLCFSEGRWWLFCTNLKSGDRSHLHLFYADALTGPYTPHFNNPVKVDIRGSRPAGPLFRLDGAWIRPAQNDAITYGHFITLNRIVQLTPRVFLEEAFAELRPDANGPFPRGLHTIHGVGDITLVDGKRRRFIPRVFLKRLVARKRRGWSPSSIGSRTP